MTLDLSSADKKPLLSWLTMYFNNKDQIPKIVIQSFGTHLPLSVFSVLPGPMQLGYIVNYF